MDYITLEKEASAEFIERKSIFTGYAAPVKTEEEAMNFIKRISPNSVYAYYIDWGRIARYSDAGEPHGTAGLPVLEIMRKGGFTDAAIVVTRYFGGILLGAGGLVRAFSAAAKVAVDAAGIVTYTSYIEFNLTCTYAEHQRIKTDIVKYETIQDSIEYTDNVELKLAIKEEKFDEFAKRISDLSAGRIKMIIIGKRFDKK